MTNTDAERVSDIVARLRRQAEVGLFGVPDDVHIVGYTEAADIIEAQSKALAEARVVKPLEWRDGEARSALGDLYSIHQLSENVWNTRFNGIALSDWQPTGEQARALADFHNERRILSSLTPTPENPNG